MYVNIMGYIKYRNVYKYNNIYIDLCISVTTFWPISLLLLWLEMQETHIQ